MSRVAQQLAQSPRGEEAGECVTACEGLRGGDDVWSGFIFVFR